MTGLDDLIRDGIGELADEARPAGPEEITARTLRRLKRRRDVRIAAGVAAGVLTLLVGVQLLGHDQPTPVTPARQPAHSVAPQPVPSPSPSESGPEPSESGPEPSESGPEPTESAPPSPTGDESADPSQESGAPVPSETEPSASQEP